MNSKIFTKIIALIWSLTYATSLSGQSITVIVKDEIPLEIEQIDINVTLTETTYDYKEPEYPNLEKPALVSSELFLSELEKNQIQSILIDSKVDAKKYYERYTKKEQVKTVTKSNFLIVIKNSNDLDQFKKLMSKSQNAKITSTDFNSKNEESTLKQLTDKIIETSRVKADKMAKLINKKTTNLSNIKVINMQTEGHPKVLMLYNLEQKAYMELEITYETEKL